MRIATRERGEIDASQVRGLDKIATEVDEKAKRKTTDSGYYINMFMTFSTIFIYSSFHLIVLGEEQEAIKEESSSIIPPYDAITTDPFKVYKLDDIVTPVEYDAINVQALLKAKTDKDRLALLPYPYALH
jgi:DNA-directed RNA polymerase I subunit RPA49